MYVRVLRCLAASTVAWMFAGCGLLLDFDPPDPVPGSLDGSIDASLLDAGLDGDTFIVDAGVTDADRLDAGLDAERRDANVDLDGSLDSSLDGALDSDIDAYLPPDPCHDEPGLCIRMSHEIAPDVTYFRSNMYWTEGGVTVESGWILESCEGGFRMIDVTTIDCLFHARTLPSGHIVYFYPMTTAGAACSSSSCPGFSGAYSYWFDGVSVPGTPGLGPVSLERRPTPDGMIMAIKYTVP
jgi:hypothetical protein